MRNLQLTIDFATMTYLVDFNDPMFVINRVQDAIIALSNPESTIVPEKLFAPSRTWVHSKPFNPLNDATQVIFWNLRKFLLCASFD